MASQSIAAQIIQVLGTPEKNHFRTIVVPELQVDLAGIPGDRHYGFTRKAGGRERWYDSGMEMRSGRQLTAVSSEELAAIACRLGLARIEPGWVGANLLVEGVPAFTLLPWGARLFCGLAGGGTGAVLVNEGENAPCRFAGAEIARHFPDQAGLDLEFVKAAKNLRGILASVERAGSIAPGNLTVKIQIQKPWTGETSP